VVWVTIGRFMLRRLSATSEADRTTLAALTRKVASALGMAEVVPVRCRDGKAEPIASGYLPAQAIAQADGWVLVSADSEGYPAGAEVMVRPLP
jgi:molybdopterin molybdotransferase